MNFNNDIPIYIQLVNALKTMIVHGNYKSGEKLPSVREFSLMFKVNPNTMQKALIELENTHLIFTERTNGKFVTNDEKLIDDIKFKMGIDTTNEYILKMKSIGYKNEDIINIIGGECGIKNK